MLSLQHDLPDSVCHFSFCDATRTASDEIEFGAWNEETIGGCEVASLEEPDWDSVFSSPAWKKNDKNMFLDSELQHVITKCQQGIPEEAFELSFRDLAELPKIVDSMRGNQGDGRDPSRHKSRSGEERKEMTDAKKRNSRRKSVDNVLLKMLFGSSSSGRRKSSGISESCTTTTTAMPKPSSRKGEKKEMEKRRDGHYSDELGSNGNRSSRRWAGVLCPFGGTE